MTTKSTKLEAEARRDDAEGALIAGLRAGHEASYRQLVVRYGGRMLATARRLLRSEEDARDAVQDAFSQAYRNFESFEGRAALGTWLHRITVNAALMKLRRRGRKPEVSIDELLPSFDDDGCRIEPLWQLDEPADSMVQREQVRELVRSSIDALPDGHRSVLVLRDIEGHDTATVAGLLEISPEAVKTRLHRARAALKKLLEPLYGGGSL